MAVVIPNSTDTTGGEEYASLDQAEPDSLDFEIVGNTGSNGVISGCGVTANGNLTINVAAGTVVVQGKSYGIGGNPALTLPISPTNTRFDAIVVRVTAGTAALTVVKGAESATNPVFPQSMSVYGGSFDGSLHIDFATDVVLAVCLREAAASITQPKIVDKRAMLKPNIMWQGTSLPTSADNGSLFFLSNEVTTGVGVIASGVYVRANGAWVSVAQNNQYAGMPIGTTVWHNGGTVPAGTLLEDGAAVSRTTYAALFAAIGTIHGAGDGSTTFNLPNTIGKLIRGDISANVGLTGGASSVTLTSANMPVHQHSLANHAHTMAHTHSIDHNHASHSTGTAGSHAHATEGKDSNSAGLGFKAQPTWASISQGTGGNIVRLTNSTASGSYDSSLGDQLVTTSDGAHTHTLNLPNHTGTSGGASDATTSAATGNTGNTGSGTSFNILPPYINKVPCIVAF